MKLLILGHARHGKDTAAEYLRDRWGVSFQSSSLTAARVILPVLNAARGLAGAPPYMSPLAAFNDRQSPRMRELWKRAISLYNAADKTALAREILKDSDCYVGMRALDEYQATQRLFDHVLWVDASERVGGRDSTMGIELDRWGMRVIDNNHTPAHLHAQLDAFMRETDQL